jgi:hypothetical protein
MPIRLFEIDGVVLVEVEDVILEADEAADLVLDLALARCLRAVALGEIADPGAVRRSARPFRRP